VKATETFLNWAGGGHFHAHNRKMTIGTGANECKQDGAYDVKRGTGMSAENRKGAAYMPGPTEPSNYQKMRVQWVS